jgi:hypothetical protein
MIEYKRMLLSREIVEQNNEEIIENEQYEYISYSLLFTEFLMSINQNIVSNDNTKFYIKINFSQQIEEESSKICQCNICYENNENKNFINFECGHKFCKECVKKTLQNEIRQKYCCAYCRSEIKEFNINDASILNEFIKYTKY